MRTSQKWVQATNEHLLQTQESGVIVHEHCPFDYCTYVPTNGVQPLNLLCPDEQCAFHRSGILCGACQTNFSHALGTSKCKQCTVPWIVLIIPLTVVAGVILVMGIMMLNLTVTVGTINGLIFYANIIRANHAIFFPHQASNSFLSVFIAWLNLDIGIEVCFYHGFDAYTKVWFQFMFPLYVWLMVIIIIAASHYSTFVSRLTGNNAVQVLAALFLLSYAKLLRIIITVLSSTQLVYPDGYVKRVWLYDGNIDYNQGKHIPLFIAALIFLILLSIPYTAILLCIQWLQKVSHLKLLFWVGYLFPLFDAYTGPYKMKHRYWTGFLLLIRVCLFLIFSLNTTSDPTINLLAIAITIFLLFMYLSVIGGVYKLWWLNVIEYAFLLNLGISSAAGLYQYNVGIPMTSISYTSSGIAFGFSAVIAIYHMCIQIIQSRKGKILVTTFKEKFNFNMEEQVVHEGINADSEVPSGKVTCSEVALHNLKEHLLQQ